MTQEYKYILEKSSRKHTCPSCGKRRLVRFVDEQSREYLPEQYGRCDREINCGYFNDPYSSGYTANIQPGQVIDKSQSSKKHLKPKPRIANITTFIPPPVLKQTLHTYEKNQFVQNLLGNVKHPLPAIDVEMVITQYYLGTITRGYRSGAVTFPFINIKGQVNAIQVKQFDKNNYTTATDFLHSIITRKLLTSGQELPGWLNDYNKNESKVNCLFGEHLLNKYINNPIALVEAPKTAIYGTIYFGFPENPQNLLWLAVYNLSSLNFKKCKVLQNRDVYLFPDLSKDGKAFKLWSKKADELSTRLPGTRFIVSDLLEQKATAKERLKGLDLADYLIQLDMQQFRNRNTVFVTEAKPVDQSVNIPILEPISEKGEFSDVSEETLFIARDTPGSWDSEISELEKYYSTIPQNKSYLQLNPWTEIVDLKSFVQRHMACVKANNGKAVYRPYLDRLIDVRNYLENSLN